MDEKVIGSSDDFRRLNKRANGLLRLIAAGKSSEEDTKELNSLMEYPAIRMLRASKTTMTWLKSFNKLVKKLAKNTITDDERAEYERRKAEFPTMMNAQIEAFKAFDDEQSRS